VSATPPEEGHRSRFRNVAFFSFRVPDDGQGLKNPVDSSSGYECKILLSDVEGSVVDVENTRVRSGL
jgi:hypothetical protein